MTIRVLLVDDEPLALERLRTILLAIGQVKIIGECMDGVSAVDTIPRLRPDVIFLDIRMPRLDGFGVLAALDPKYWPWTIFVTAYEQHAIRAFEARALDYLLKPITRDRVKQTIERVRDRLDSAHPVPALQEWLAERQTLNRLAVPDGDSVIYVSVGAIDWIESASNYVVIHAGERSHVLRQTLNQMERRLPSNIFVRISRSVILNVCKVKQIECRGSQYYAALNDGQLIAVTRGRTELGERLA